MPEYRAHLAGTAALVVEFGEQSNQQVHARDLPPGRRPTEVCQNDMGDIIEGAG